MPKRQKKVHDPDEIIKRTFKRSFRSNTVDCITISNVHHVIIQGGEKYSASMTFEGTATEREELVIDKFGFIGCGEKCMLQLTLPDHIECLSINECHIIAIVDFRAHDVEIEITEDDSDDESDEPRSNDPTTFKKLMIQNSRIKRLEAEIPCLGVSYDGVYVFEKTKFDTDGGDISLKNTVFVGLCEMSTVNGNISVIGCECGSYSSLKTINGSMVCSNTENMSLESTNQSVEVNDCKGVDVSTVNGTLYGSGQEMPKFETTFGKNEFIMITQ